MSSSRTGTRGGSRTGTRGGSRSSTSGISIRQAENTARVVQDLGLNGDECKSLMRAYSTYNNKISTARRRIGEIEQEMRSLPDHIQRAAMGIRTQEEREVERETGVDLETQLEHSLNTVRPKELQNYQKAANTLESNLKKEAVKVKNIVNLVPRDYEITKDEIKAIQERLR
ncbi:hypothetical protein ACEPAH_8531 [Sanghuangporus vaninii]